MTALTDRYVWAVLRAVPALPTGRARARDPCPRRRRDRGTERATGTRRGCRRVPDAAERAALAELGDPGLLAARYAEQTALPHRPDLLPRVEAAPDAASCRSSCRSSSLVVLAANLLSGMSHGRAGDRGRHRDGLHRHPPDALLVDARLRGHRSGSAGHEAHHSGKPWSVDDLPELPDDGRIGIARRGQHASSPTCSWWPAILWVQLAAADRARRPGLPTVRPGPLVVLAALLPRRDRPGDRVHDRAVPARSLDHGRSRSINAVLGAAFAIPAVWLLQNDLLFNPALVAAVG